MSEPTARPPEALLDGTQPNATLRLLTWAWSQPLWGPLAVILFHLGVLWGMVAVYFPQTGGQDLYWYLATGQQIATAGAPLALAQDPLSWTAGTHTWVNHEWLFTLWLFRLHEAGGFEALIAVKYLLLALWAGAFVWMGIRLARDWYLGLLTGLLTIPMLGGFCDLRPQLITYLLTTLLLTTWYRAPARPAIALGVWVVLLVFWANVHAAVLFGVGLLCTLLGIQALQGGVTWRLALTGIVLALAAPLLNPYGAQIYTYALGWVGNPELKYAILEWRPISYGGFTSQAELCWLLWPVGTLGLLLFTGTLGRLRSEPQGWLMGAIYLMPLLAVRHLPLAHIALIPWWFQEIARTLPWLSYRESPPPDPKSETPPPPPQTRLGSRMWVEGLTVLVAMAATPEARLLLPWQGLPQRPIEHLHRAYTFPQGAWAFLVENRIEGQLFNDYDWGGWIDWQNAQQPAVARPVFIDGRLDTVFPAGVIDAYGNLTSAQPTPLTERSGWMAYGDQIQIAILRTSIGGQEPDLLTQWKNVPEFALVYQDQLASVLVRRSLVTDEFITQAQGLHLPVPNDPQAHFGRAMQVLSFGDVAGALRELEATLALDPDYPGAQDQLLIVRQISQPTS